MKARTALSLVAAALLAACSAPAEQASTFSDPTSPTSADTYSAPVVSESPTDPAPAADAEAAPDTAAEPCTQGTKTAAGCEVTYEIDVAAASDKLPKLCAGGFTAFNDCKGSAIELSWTDLGERAPKSARIEIGVSIFCADPRLDVSKPQRQDVSINGGTIGSFDADKTACACNAPTTAYAFDVTPAALEGYKTGGQNSIKVEGPNRCIGVGGLDATHTVARIVVTY